MSALIGKKASLLDPGATLTGDEIVYIVQGGNSRRTTAADLAALAGSSDVTSFTDLDDVPGSYAGQGGRLVAVNLTETGLTFTFVPGGLAEGDDAGDVPFTPGGGIAATNVQAAIEELDDEKLAKAGGTLTGALTLHADPSSALHAATKQYVDGRRERLAANRTYYVDATDGNDANNGLAAGSGNAFATLQKALDVCASIDFGGFTVTVQLADGTYSRGVVSVTVGQAAPANLVIQGNTGDDDAVTIDCAVTSGGAIEAGPGARCRVQHVKITGSGTGARGLLSDGYIEFGAVVFGACTNAHMMSRRHGTIDAIANYEVAGNAPRHWYAAGLGVVRCAGRTLTLTGTPAFSTAFLQSNFLGHAAVDGNTFSGSATGKRYDVTRNGVAFVGADPDTYLPGNVAGTTGTGGTIA